MHRYCRNLSGLSGKIVYDQSNSFRKLTSIIQTIIGRVVILFFAYYGIFHQTNITFISIVEAQNVEYIISEHLLVHKFIWTADGKNGMDHQQDEDDDGDDEEEKKKSQFVLYESMGGDLLFSKQLIKFSFTYDFVATLTADLNKCVSFKWMCLPNPQSSKSI